MNIATKIKHTSLYEVKRYKEGVFWMAYEQSAYACFLQKTVKPTKKHIKIINAEVVQIGFPLVVDFFKLNTAHPNKIFLQYYTKGVIPLYISN